MTGAQASYLKTLRGSQGAGGVRSGSRQGRGLEADRRSPPQGRPRVSRARSRAHGPRPSRCISRLEPPQPPCFEHFIKLGGNRRGGYRDFRCVRPRRRLEKKVKARFDHGTSRGAAVSGGPARSERGRCPVRWIDWRAARRVRLSSRGTGANHGHRICPDLLGLIFLAVCRKPPVPTRRGSVSFTILISAAVTQFELNARPRLPVGRRRETPPTSSAAFVSRYCRSSGRVPVLLFSRAPRKSCA